MTRFSRHTATWFLAASLALVGCSDRQDNPGSTLPEEMTPEGDTLVPTTQGSATIPAPPEGG